MNITILTDNPNSWFVPYGKKLSSQLSALGHSVDYVFNSSEIKEGDICFLLSCTRLVDEKTLLLNKNNIVVHASDLPMGKGFAPLQWQILEGKNEICLTLFEVAKGVDEGPFYLKSILEFNGLELYDELRLKLANKILEMCAEYVNNYSSLRATPQSGTESFYKRRTAADDEIDVNKTIADLFNHLRIADNDNFPLYFKIADRKYILKIYTDSE